MNELDNRVFELKREIYELAKTMETEEDFNIIKQKHHALYTAMVERRATAGKVGLSKEEQQDLAQILSFVELLKNINDRKNNSVEVSHKVK